MRFPKVTGLGRVTAIALPWGLVPCLGCSAQGPAPTAAAPAVDTSAASAPTAAPATLDDACREMAEASCDLYLRCAPHFARTSLGDRDRCLATTTAECRARTSAPGSLTKPAALERCTADLTKASCDVPFSAGHGEGCNAMPGALVDGDPCTYGTQCASGFCAHDKAALCGTCAPRPREGDPCPCSSEHFCHEGRCRDVAPLGGACAADGVAGAPSCRDLGRCYEGKCVRGAKEGEACGRIGERGPPCDDLAGLRCNVRSVCEKTSVVGAGERCGLLPLNLSPDAPPGLADCDVESFCDLDTELCVAKRKIGEACTASFFCASDRCAGGVCVDPLAASCPPSGG
jgi:hypothetical protein